MWCVNSQKHPSVKGTTQVMITLIVSHLSNNQIILCKYGFPCMVDASVVKIDMPYAISAHDVKSDIFVLISYESIGQILTFLMVYLFL